MNTWGLLLFLHVGGVLLLTAGVGASLACKSMALRVKSPHAVLALLAAARRATKYCMMPGSILLLASGAALVVKSDGAYEFHELWITGAVLLWIASSVVGVVLHAPRAKAANLHANELADSGRDTDDELRGIIRRGIPASALDTLLLLGMVALMIFKPGS